MHFFGCFLHDNPSFMQYILNQHLMQAISQLHRMPIGPERAFQVG
jgi:hypothetical protein